MPLAQRIAPGAAVLSPRGKVLEQGMARFFRRDADGTWDRDDLRHATNDLSGFLQRARTHYKIEKPVALGYSNGANVGWSLLLRDPAALKGAVLMRAGLPFDPRPLPDLSGIPVLLLSGKHDEMISIDRAGVLAALLGEAGADVTYEVLPTGHGLTGEDLKLAGDWLAAHR